MAPDDSGPEPPEPTEPSDSSSESGETNTNVADTSPVDSIASFLVEEASQSPQVFGSSLGSALKVAFPNLDIRSRFGGLRRFIADHCGGQVIWINKHGGDDIYVHADSANGAPQPQEPPDPVWAAFTNPNYAPTLTIDRSSGTLTILASAKVPVGDVVVVPKTLLSHIFSATAASEGLGNPVARAS